MEKEWRSRGEGRGKWRDKALDALCARGGCWRVSVLRIPRRRETAGKNVKDNGMCRVAHAWLRGMRPRNGTSVSHNVCHETRGLIARNRSPPLSLSLSTKRASEAFRRRSEEGTDSQAGRKIGFRVSFFHLGCFAPPSYSSSSFLRYDVICFRFARFAR